MMFLLRAVRKRDIFSGLVVYVTMETIQSLVWAVVLRKGAEPACVTPGQRWGGAGTGAAGGTGCPLFSILYQMLRIWHETLSSFCDIICDSSFPCDSLCEAQCAVRSRLRSGRRNSFGGYVNLLIFPAGYELNVRYSFRMTSKTNTNIQFSQTYIIKRLVALSLSQKQSVHAHNSHSYTHSHSHAHSLSLSFFSLTLLLSSDSLLFQSSVNGDIYMFWLFLVTIIIIFNVYYGGKRC